MKRLPAALIVAVCVALLFAATASAAPPAMPPADARITALETRVSAIEAKLAVAYAVPKATAGCPCGPNCPCGQPANGQAVQMVQVCDGTTCRMVPVQSPAAAGTGLAYVQGSACDTGNCGSGNCGSGGCGTSGSKHGFHPLGFLKKNK